MLYCFEVVFLLICPICSRPLEKGEHTYFCDGGHSFDVASSGYCNLLVRNRGGKWIGDNKQMVAARRSFLDSGAYAPLRDAVCAQALELLCDSPSPRLVDAGCGEGYYTRAVAQVLSHKAFTMVGMDISKSATQYAAKRDSLTTYITASCFHMPVASGKSDLILSLFAPAAAEEFFRVLAPGGHVLMAVPGAEHLWELKKAVYDTPYLNREEKHTLPGFSLTDRKSIKYAFELTSKEQIRSLFSMTPYCHRTPKAGLERLERLERLQTTLSFLILTFQKDHN